MVATADTVVFAQNVTVLPQSSLQKPLLFLSSFSPATWPCHWLTLSSVSHSGLADSGKRELMNMQFELKKLIIYQESGGG